MRFRPIRGGAKESWPVLEERKHGQSQSSEITRGNLMETWKLNFAGLGLGLLTITSNITSVVDVSTNTNILMSYSI